MGEIKTLSNILSWFKRGMEPTEQQFEDTFTSFWHKEDDLIPISSVDGLAEELNNKYDKDAGAIQQKDGIEDVLGSLMNSIPFAYSINGNTIRISNR